MKSENQANLIISKEKFTQVVSYRSVHIIQKRLKIILLILLIIIAVKLCLLFQHFFTQLDRGHVLVLSGNIGANKYCNTPE